MAGWSSTTNDTLSCMFEYLLKPKEQKNGLWRDKKIVILKVKEYVRVRNVYLFSQKVVSYKRRCGVCLTGKDRKGILYVITLSTGK